MFRRVVISVRRTAARDGRAVDGVGPRRLNVAKLRTFVPAKVPSHDSTHNGRLFGIPALRGYLSGVARSLTLTIAVRSSPSGPTLFTSFATNGVPPSVSIAPEPIA